MKPATWPRDDVMRERLLNIDPRAQVLRDLRIADLPGLLRSGDVLVVNDAATLPASLRGHTASGTPIEVRLVGELPDGTFRAVLFGPGDWRTPTERRPAPDRVARGTTLSFDGMNGVVESVSRISDRLVTLRFDRSGSALWSHLYRIGDRCSTRIRALRSTCGTCRWLTHRGHGRRRCPRQAGHYAGRYSSVCEIVE